MEEKEELKDLEAEDEYGDEGEGRGKNQRQKNYHHYHDFRSGQKRGLIKIFP